MPRRVWWAVGLGVLGLFIVVQWAGNVPARVTVINTSGLRLEHVTIRSSGEETPLGSLANGEARSVQLEPGAPPRLRFGERSWEPAEPLTPGGAVVLYILPGPRVELRSKLGTIRER
jgi:hypothetical protein